MQGAVQTQHRVQPLLALRLSPEGQPLSGGQDDVCPRAIGTQHFYHSARKTFSGLYDGNKNLLNPFSFRTEGSKAVLLQVAAATQQHELSRSGVTLIRMSYKLREAVGETQYNLEAASTRPRHALRWAADSYSTLTRCGFCETRLLRLVLTPLPRSRCPSWLWTLQARGRNCWHCSISSGEGASASSMRHGTGSVPVRGRATGPEAPAPVSRCHHHALLWADVPGDGHHHPCNAHTPRSWNFSSFSPGQKLPAVSGEECTAESRERRGCDAREAELPGRSATPRCAVPGWRPAQGQPTQGRAPGPRLAPRPAPPLTLLPPLRAAGGSRAVLRRLPISAYSLAARPVCREGVCPVLPDGAAPSSRGSKLASAVSNGQLTSPQARLFGFFSPATPHSPLLPPPSPPRCVAGDGSCRLTLSRGRRCRGPPTLPRGLKAGGTGRNGVRSGGARLAALTSRLPAAAGAEPGRAMPSCARRPRR